MLFTWGAMPMPTTPTTKQAVLYRALLLEVLDHLKPRSHSRNEHPCVRSCATCRVMLGRIELAMRLPEAAVAALTREVELDRQRRPLGCPFSAHADDCDCGGSAGDR